MRPRETWEELEAGGALSVICQPPGALGGTAFHLILQMLQQVLEARGRPCSVHRQLLQCPSTSRAPSVPFSRSTLATSLTGLEPCPLTWVSAAGSPSYLPVTLVLPATLTVCPMAKPTLPLPS